MSRTHRTIGYSPMVSTILNVIHRYSRCLALFSPLFTVLITVTGRLNGHKSPKRCKTGDKKRDAREIQQ